MSDVGAADRSRLLRLKKAELSGIIKSRKRKLREFFAVCDNRSLIPQLDISNPDTPPVSSAEAHFLDLTDILKNRLFDESHLPVRRHIPSDPSTLKRLLEEKNSNDAIHADLSQYPGHPLRHDSISANSQSTTPKACSIPDNSANSTRNQTESSNPQESLIPKASPKASPKNLQSNSSTSTSTSTQRKVKETEASVSPPNAISDRILSNVEKFLENGIGTPTNGPLEVASDTSSIEKCTKALPNLASYSHGIHKSKIKNITTDGSIHEPSIRKPEIDNHHEGISERNPPAGAHSLDISSENIPSPCSNLDTCSTETSTKNDQLTDTSPSFKNCHSIDELHNSKGDNIVALKQSKLSGRACQYLQPNGTLKAKLDIRSIDATSDKFECVKDLTLTNRAINPIVDSENIERPSSSSKESSGISSRLWSGLSLKTTTKLSSSEGGVSCKTKDETIEQIVSPMVDHRTPRADGTKVNTAIIQDLCGNNDSIKTTASQSFVLTENLKETEGSIKSVHDPKLKNFASLVPFKPMTITPPLERRNTRIGSGAIERRTVSEIIGDAQSSSQVISGPSLKNSSKSVLDSAKAPYFASRTAKTQSPTTNVRISTQKQKEKGRSKLSNVIFANKSVRINTTRSLNSNAKTESLKEDYFLPLFLANASSGKGCIPAIDNLLTTAHKTITTANAFVPIHENQTAKILKRIYNLQSSHKWSLRQPRRTVEPARDKTHWDFLLHEVSWMRTDFKEERKWKKTIARNLAFACAEWISSCKEDRRLLQVNVTPRNLAPVSESEKVLTVEDLSQARTPNILHHIVTREINKSEGFVEPRLNIMEAAAPADIFSSHNDEFLFCLRKFPAAEKILSKLPMYASPFQVPTFELQTSGSDPDRFWKRPALPLSKYVEGKMRLDLNPPLRKKSRFEYEEEDEEDCEHVLGEDRPSSPPLPPECTDVALFDPKNRHILERIRNVNCFRPPSEFQMPQQAFYECRTASQWTWDEDKELKVLVRDYTYNWSLISSILSSKSKSDLATGAERRTPWECFERWIELEGLPGDMQKTYYFRLYTSRIENANKNLIAAQPAHNSQGQNLQARKRSTTSIRVERRRNQKHLILIDTMRKLAKKRETTLQKQQHAASMAAVRKSQETIPHAVFRNISATTPQDFSRLRYEREEVMKERAMFTQVQRRVAMAQRNTGVNNQLQTSHPSVVRHSSSGVSITPNHAISGNPNRSHQASPSVASHPLSTSGIRITSTGVNSVLQAPMQGQIPTSNTPPDAGLVSRAHAISQQQQAILRQQQQHQLQLQQQSQINNQLSNSPRTNCLSTSNYSMQGNLIPPFSSNKNGVISSSASSLSSPSQTDSRRTAKPPQALTHVQRMEIQYKAKYPSATPEQVTSMISQALSQSIQQRHNITQNVMNVAAGGPVAIMNGMSGSQNTPQMYAQILRHQQENQQKHTTAPGDKFKSNITGSSVNGSSGLGHTHRTSATSLPSTN